MTTRLVSMALRSRMLFLLLLVPAVLLAAPFSPLVALAFAILSGFALLVLRNPKAAVFLLFATRPIIDATWALRLPAVDLNLLQITGVAFPVVAFLVLYLNRFPVSRLVGTRIFLLFVIVNVVSYGTFIAADLNRFVGATAIFFQFLNSFASYLLLPLIVRDEKDLKQFFLVLCIAGLFPLVTAYLQIFGFVHGRTIRTTGELIRLAGLYYDSTNLRMYSLQTLLAIFVYTTMFLRPGDAHYRLQRIIFLAMVPPLFVVLYRGYSKSALAIVAVWFVIYSLLRQRLFVTGFVVAGLLTAFALTDRIQQEVSSLFYKEISFLEGSMRPELEYTMLGGRFVRWGDLVRTFEDADLADQLIGINFTLGIYVHNDFLRVLITNGYVGLTAYAILILTIAWGLAYRYYEYRDNVALVSLMVFAMFLIDSIGLVPLVYPGYCWFVFGIISIALNRPGPREDSVRQSHPPRRLVIP